MSWHRWARLLVVGMLAVLHGMAPLLHAHPGGDPLPARGIHLHLKLAASGAPATGAHALELTPADSPAIGIGAELKRDRGGQGDDAATVAQALPRVAARCDQARCSIGTAPVPRRSSWPLRPPSQAPPPFAA